jgi:FAD/FMN-containing dehydrogenase
MTVTFVDQVVDQLHPRFRGDLLTPASPGYDEARQVFNGVIDRKPAIIARCTSTADVVAAINTAREHELIVSIRGGGHNVAGSAVNDGGLVIDLSEMRGVAVDPETRTARVQGGAIWADVDSETAKYGLVCPGGKVSSTGVAGFTLHGGMSWFIRKLGLALDSIRSVEIVTADGQVRIASETENPDLFWAVRGAGSNFGVVTSFEFALHQVGPEVAFAGPFYAVEDAAKILRAYRSFAESAPAEVSSQLLFWGVPEHPMFPAELHGKPVLITAGCYCGDASAGEAALQPLRELGTPILDLSGPMPYTALQTAFDPFFLKGDNYYFKSMYFDELSDATIDALIEMTADRPTSRTLITFWHIGGAMGWVPEDASAFGHRDARFMFSLDTSWDDPADNDRCIEWSRKSCQSMREQGTGGMYLNFSGFGEEKDALVRAGYGTNYDRLVELKTKYDPGNLFRVNSNIAPKQ